MFTDAVTYLRDSAGVHLNCIVFTTIYILVNRFTRKEIFNLLIFMIYNNISYNFSFNGTNMCSVFTKYIKLFRQAASKYIELFRRYASKIKM